VKFEKLQAMEDEYTDGRYYILGHHNWRRSIAAVSAQMREDYGWDGRREMLEDVHLADVTVAHLWVREEEPDSDACVASLPQHPQAWAVTVVDTL
jgi:hypothetical protein